MRVSRARARWLGALVWLVGVPLAHAGVPWALSLVGARHGWDAGGPGALNWLGLGPVAAGAALLAWVGATGVKHAGELPDEIALDWTPKLLLARGPYAWSRNPMYVGELTLWLGWAVLFGSAIVAAGAVALGLGMANLVRREERDLAERFGATYAEYRVRVPRWLGWPRGRALP